MMSPFFHFTESMERFQLFAADTALVTSKWSQRSGANSSASAHAWSRARSKMPRVCSFQEEESFSYAVGEKAMMRSGSPSEQASAVA